MASPSHPLRRQSSATFTHAHSSNDYDDGGLTQSLSNLSIGHPENVPLSPGTKPKTPLKGRGSRHSSPSPHRQPGVRSSSRPRDAESTAGSQTLLRKASMNSLHSANGVAAPKAPSRRSSHGTLLTPSSPTATFSVPLVEKPPVTAASVASAYLSAEIEALHGESSTAETNAVVILNDAVYGHRFSRPRTSRSALATIVERPERVRAAVFGISMAYIRLGDRHCEGAVPIHPKRNPAELKTVPFRIQKTSRTMSLTSPAVTNVHGLKWMEELKMMCTSAEAKLAMGGKELQRPELNRGDQGPPPKLHEGDLYLCSESLDAMEGSMGAVCEAVDVVFGSGPRTAFVGIRPPGHHCSASYPSGFCWVNNVHVGIMHAMLNHDLTHAAIIDFDLHHGDGSQAIAWQHNNRANSAHKNAPAWKKTSIGYFSLHDINSYPCEGGDEDKVKNASLCIDNAHGQSIWNVHLQSWKSEQDFWRLYETQYYVILEKTRKYLRAQAERVKASGQTPRAAIFFSAGFDASEWESAGMQRHQVNVPTEFYARLGEDVVSLAAEEGLSVEGRVISVLEGGYSDRALCSGVMSHMSGLVAKRASPPPATQQDSLALGPRHGDVGLTYDPAWWSSAELDKLESLMTRPPTPPKKPRFNAPPTYSSPTHASTAKIAEPVKIRRSFSGLSQNGPTISARPPSPPPPEVPWPTATHELSKILIPWDRQTESCKPEDLNAEATKVRRHRQSLLLGTAMPAPPVPSEQPSARMALRGRRPKPIGAIDEEGSDSRPGSRAGGTESAPVSPRKRAVTPSKAAASTPVTRRTQAAARATPSQTPKTQTARRASRRLSGTPALLSPMKENTEKVSADAISGRSSAAEDNRPSSSASVGTQGSSKIVVKKSRPPPVRQSSAPKAGRGGKKPAIGRLDSSGNELEQITSGMKKIKINLITKSQREAREQAKREAEGGMPLSAGEPPQTPVEAGRPLATPTLEEHLTLPAPAENLVGASPMPFVPSGISVPAGTVLSSSEVSTPTLEQGSMSPTPGSVPMPTSSPGLPSSEGDSAGGMDFFIPYQPEGPSPVAVSQTEPLKWLPPNAAASAAGTPVATPSPVKKHTDNLFRYTSGGIPFAPRPEVQKSEEVKAEGKERAAMWDIPEAPQ